MGYKVSRCLFCVPIHHAVVMIGSLHLFRFIANILLTEYFLSFTELFTVGAFLAMFARDSKETRKIFFASYCFYVAIINFMELYLRSYPTEEEQVSKLEYFKSLCDEEMKEEDYTEEEMLTK